MAYISENLLRIAIYGPTSAADFLELHCRWHKHASLDESGELRPCIICLEPLHALEPISLSSSHITPTQRFRGRLTINNKCNHILHTHCLQEYIKHGNTCPICRCHWFDSAAEEKRAYEILAVLQALDRFDYSHVTSAQKRIKITIHAVVFTEMPAIVAHWLSKMPRHALSERHAVAGRVARSGQGVELAEVVTSAFRELDGKKRRLGRLEKEIAARAVNVASGEDGKGTMREEHAVFLGVVTEIVVGYYAYSQGLMDVLLTRLWRVLSWLHLR